MNGELNEEKIITLSLQNITAPATSTPLKYSKDNHQDTVKGIKGLFEKNFKPHQPGKRCHFKKREIV